MKKIFILLYLLFSTYLYANTINIAVSANVSYVIPKIIQEFYKLHPDIKINTILGSSGKLTAQILHNAPLDIFLSANMLYPKKLYIKGYAINKPCVYAKGSIVLFSIKKRDFSKGLNILLHKNIKTIAIANAKTAPYGIAIKQLLKNKKLYNKLKSKFVYGESIGQTLNYSVKVCDIGFIAKSALSSKMMGKYKKNINYTDINPKLYSPIKQGIVILKNGKNKAEVKLFYDFIFSLKVKKIFNNFGYITL